MQRGMNQTLAWLLAVVLAGIVFGIGGFWVMKRGGSHGGEHHEMAAKAHVEEKKGEHGDKAEHESKTEHGAKEEHSEVLRPEH